MAYETSQLDSIIPHIPPRKLTWNLKMMVSSKNLLFQGFIFRFHVNLPGCTTNNQVFLHCSTGKSFGPLPLVPRLRTSSSPPSASVVSSTFASSLGSSKKNHHPGIHLGFRIILLPSREWIHIPPNGKFGKSSSSKCHFFGGICFFSLEGKQPGSASWWPSRDLLKNPIGWRDKTFSTAPSEMVGVFNINNKVKKELPPGMSSFCVFFRKFWMHEKETVSKQDHFHSSCFVLIHSQNLAWTIMDPD